MVVAADIGAEFSRLNLNGTALFICHITAVSPILFHEEIPAFVIDSNLSAVCDKEFCFSVTDPRPFVCLFCLRVSPV